LIFVDTSIISSLSKINRLDLLNNFSCLWTTSGVVEECVDSDISPIINSLSKALDNWLETMTVTDIQQIRKIQNNYPSLSFVDSGLIVLSRKNDAVLFSDDTKMLEVAENEFDIRNYDLFEILLALKKRNIINRKEILTINENLKKKDNYEFSEENLERLLE